MDAKRDLRQELRRCRDGLASKKRHDDSARVVALLLDAIVAAGARRVALYAAIGSEVDLGPLHDALVVRGVEVFYPRCDVAAGTLAFVPVSERDALVPGYRGIPEPLGEPVPLATLDWVVVPGLAFDGRGGRLGYGAGFYDRTLAAFGGEVVGVAFECQHLRSVPHEPHDRRVQRLFTEAGSWRAEGLP